MKYKGRYNKASEKKLKKLTDATLTNKLTHVTVIDGSSSYVDYLRAPYIDYENLLNENIDSQSVLLDLCCGDGIHSLFIARLGAKKVVATDIAYNSIKVANIKAEKEKLLNIDFIVGDAENLDFPADSFDIVCCVGSLSYVDLTMFVTQVKKVLKLNGKFICVDSFDYNINYRANRFIDYLLGKRSYSTLKRMPNSKHLNFFKQEFKELDIKYYGIFFFITPLLNLFFSHNSIAQIMTILDSKF